MGWWMLELDPPGDEWKETERVQLVVNQNGMFDTMAINEV